METMQLNRPISQELQEEFQKLFPKDLWFVPTGVDPSNGKLTYEPIFPFKKKSFSQKEKKFFQKLIESKINREEEYIKFYKGIEKNENATYESRKPIDEYQASTPVNDSILLNKEKHLQNLKAALTRSKNGIYGKIDQKVENGIIHPYRLFETPHTTHTVEQKNSKIKN